jgi:hypothetical protein
LQSGIEPPWPSVVESRPYASVIAWVSVSYAAPLVAALNGCPNASRSVDTLTFHGATASRCDECVLGGLGVHAGRDAQG